MPDRKIDAETRTRLEVGAASVDGERGTGPPGLRDSEARDKGHQGRESDSAGAGRVVWHRQSVALIDFGVYVSWCALISRGPAASISRFGLRTTGFATWVFGQPRRASVGCGVPCGTADGTCLREPRS
jgi:hypothetical protein